MLLFELIIGAACIIITFTLRDMIQNKVIEQYKKIPTILELDYWTICTDNKSRFILLLYFTALVSTLLMLYVVGSSLI